MTAPWPCDQCGGPGFRNVAARGYCATCLSLLYRKFQANVWSGTGCGVLAGVRRPDHGPEYAELECVACSATWVGVLFEACPWCVENAERIAGWQARMTLTPPDVELDDRNYETRITAWADRLERAVDAEIITTDQATRAWRKAVEHVAAA